MKIILLAKYTGVTPGLHQQGLINSYIGANIMRDHRANSCNILARPLCVSERASITKILDNLGLPDRGQPRSPGNVHGLFDPG